MLFYSNWSSIFRLLWSSRLLISLNQLIYWINMIDNFSTYFDHFDRLFLLIHWSNWSLISSLPLINLIGNFCISFDQIHCYFHRIYDQFHCLFLCFFYQFELQFLHIWSIISSISSRSLMNLISINQVDKKFLCTLWSILLSVVFTNSKRTVLYCRSL